MKFNVGEKVVFTKRIFDQWRYVCVGDVGEVVKTVKEGNALMYCVSIQSNSSMNGVICDEQMIERFR